MSNYIWNMGSLELQEDHFYLNDELGIYAVADGLGGLSHGDRASDFVVDFISKNAERIYHAEALETKKIILELDLLLLETLGRYVGSTLTLAIVLQENRIRVAHMGDSRAYLVTEIDRSFQKEQITRDHKYGHFVTNFIGDSGTRIHGKEKKKFLECYFTGNFDEYSQWIEDYALEMVEIKEFDYRSGETLWLTTDGFYNYWTKNEERFQTLMSTQQKNEFEKLNQNHLYEDNATAIFVAL